MLGEMNYRENIVSKDFLHLLFELSAISVFKHFHSDISSSLLLLRGLRKRLKMCIKTTVNRIKQRLVLFAQLGCDKRCANAGWRSSWQKTRLCPSGLKTNRFKVLLCLQVFVTAVSLKDVFPQSTTSLSQVSFVLPEQHKRSRRNDHGKAIIWNVIVVMLHAIVE